ncbi:MAG: hypothetical protein LBH85_05600 [Treponema sp.]|nr:hypothetical protein [Treponema sp.]
MKKNAIMPDACLTMGIDFCPGSEISFGRSVSSLRGMKIYLQRAQKHRFSGASSHYAESTNKR